MLVCCFCDLCYYVLLVISEARSSLAERHAGLAQLEQTRANLRN